MNCEVCGKAEATVLYTHVAENEKKSVYMCGTCVSALRAKKRGAPAQPAPAQPAPAATPKTKVKKELRELDRQTGPALCCSRCKTTYDEFRKRGRFGCSGCYEAFAPELERLLKRIHGSLEHRGKGLVSRQAGSGDQLADMDALRQALEQAVSAEAYEEAAELRDRIRALEAAQRDTCAPESPRDPDCRP